MQTLDELSLGLITMTIYCCCILPTNDDVWTFMKFVNGTGLALQCEIDFEKKLLFDYFINITILYQKKFFTYIF